MATVAREFQVLPSVVARDLDSDPEMLSLECLSLLQYASAKALWDSDPKRARSEGSAVMEQVIDNDFALAAEQMEQ